MRMVIRAFALVLLIGTLGVWASLGGSWGWTEAKAAGKPADSAEYRARFTPGVEFLALGVGGAIVIFAATLFVRITPKD